MSRCAECGLPEATCLCWAGALTVRLAEWDEVEQEARDLLPHRTAYIRDGRLYGRHWFVALLSEAKDIVHRRKMWDRRTDGQ